MKLNAPRLARIRSNFSRDGQFAQFTMLNKAGGNLSFTIPFSELGALLTAFRSVAKQMGEMLEANALAAEAQVAEGLAKARPATALAIGRDADTGDALLWFESDDGGLTVRITEQMRRDLRDSLDQHASVSARRLAAE